MSTRHRPRVSFVVPACVLLAVWLSVLPELRSLRGQARADGVLPPAAWSRQYLDKRDSALVTIEFESALIETCLVREDVPEGLGPCLDDPPRRLLHKAIWSGGVDDGLIVYFSQSDPASLDGNTIYLEGFDRVGLRGFFTPPKEWIPSRGDLLTGDYRWQWSGTAPSGESFDQTYRVAGLDSLILTQSDQFDVVQAWKLVREVVAPPASPPSGYLRGEDGAFFDDLGRRVDDVRGKQGDVDPRWYVRFNGRSLLLEDDFVTFIEVLGASGLPPVGTRSLSFGELKRGF